MLQSKMLIHKVINDIPIMLYMNMERFECVKILLERGLEVPFVPAMDCISIYLKKSESISKPQEQIIIDIIQLLFSMKDKGDLDNAHKLILF